MYVSHILEIATLNEEILHENPVFSHLLGLLQVPVQRPVRHEYMEIMQGFYY